MFVSRPSELPSNLPDELQTRRKLRIPLYTTDMKASSDEYDSRKSHLSPGSWKGPGHGEVSHPPTPIGGIEPITRSTPPRSSCRSSLAKPSSPGAGVTYKSVPPSRPHANTKTSLPLMTSFEDPDRGARKRLVGRP